MTTNIILSPQEVANIVAVHLHSQGLEIVGKVKLDLETGMTIPVRKAGTTSSLGNQIAAIESANIVQR